MGENTSGVVHHGHPKTTYTDSFNPPWMAAAVPPEDDELMNLITWNGAKDLYGKAKGTGLFNLEQDLDLQNLGFLKDLEARKNFQENLFGNLRLQNLDRLTHYQLMNMITLKGAKDLYGKAKGTGLFNLDSNPANEPWRNGMTDYSLQNLGLIKTRPHRKGTMQERGNRIYKGLKKEGWLMNLDNNPANDPWRNGDTDAYLMNLDQQPYAPPYANDPWRNGHFIYLDDNLEQDLELQNLMGWIKKPDCSLGPC